MPEAITALDDIELSEITAYQDGKTVTLDTLPPLVLSEVLRDLHNLVEIV